MPTTQEALVSFFYRQVRLFEINTVFLSSQALLSFNKNDESMSLSVFLLGILQELKEKTEIKIVGGGGEILVRTVKHLIN